MEFSQLQCTKKSRRQSRRQSPGQVHDKVTDTNHESQRRDLCRELSWL